VEYLDSLACSATGRPWRTDLADDGDIARLGEVGPRWRTNPMSNLKLGSGIAPWRALLGAGVNLAWVLTGCRATIRQHVRRS